jgi:peptidoglycan/LPS O-acetylase OafA/YrhL
MSLVYGKRQEPVKPLYFYKKRLTRILPVYWLAFIITLLLVLFVKGSVPKGFIILLHAFGLQSWDPGYVLDLNYTTWSVSVELFFYALFPFILSWMQRQSMRTVLIATLILYALQSWQHIYFVNHLSDGSKRIEEFISSFPLWQLGTFVAGMCTARAIILGKVPAWFQKGALLFFMLAMVLFVYIIYVPNAVLKYIHNGLLSPLFALTVLSLYFDTSLLGKTLSRPALSRLGDLSYGIFVFQYPLWLICGALAPIELQTSSIYFFTYLFLVLICSHLVNQYYEKPILLKLRQRYGIA